jgi:RNA polymerase sigma-70 factor (ECF subfamily)
MTDSISSALFPRFRPTSGIGTREPDSTVPDAQTRAVECSQNIEQPLGDQKKEWLTLEQASDEALLAALRNGGQGEIGQLFRRHARTIHGVGKRILRDPAEADDLVQEVFLYVLRKYGLFDSSKGSARSWLIQIAYTQAFQRRRKLKSLGFYEPIVDEKCCAQSAELAYDGTVEALFGRNCWKAIMEDLTHDQKRVLKLHFFEGYTFTEIAEKLGQSYANVRNHHYRGLEKLRSHLAEGQLNRR